MKISRDKVRKYIQKEAVGLTTLLLMGYMFSLLAPLYYFFDLFSHFTIQYVIGGAVLAPALFYIKRWKWGLVALTICLLCLIESRMNLHHPLRLFPESGQAIYKLATYNHNYGRLHFNHIENWLLKEDTDFDLIILQEATERTVEMAERLSHLYPYQIHEPRENAFGMVIISRHPFVKSAKIALPGPYYTDFAAKIVIKTDKAKEPLTVYALHPPPPTGPQWYEQRNSELEQIATIIKQDQAKNIIAIGDWNITPFAPVFGEVLKTSGLNYQAYGLLLNPTWPTFNYLPFLKIPIDHVLYSDGLIQTGKKAGPAFMSDHHSLIATFAEK